MTSPIPMTDNTGIVGLPHPHLRVPTLYAALYDVGSPLEIDWSQIADAFEPCGPITQGGRYRVTTDRGVLMVLTVVLRNLFQAEMALATLQGVPVPRTDPPFFLELYPSLNLSTAVSSDPFFPQYVRYSDHEIELPPAQWGSAQDVFTWFRRAGPLVSVHVYEDVGWTNPTCIVQYWHASDAQYATSNCKTLHPALGKLPPFELRTYDPRKLYCAFLGASFTEATLRETFSKFGQIVESRMVEVGVPESFGFVSFASTLQAEAAMKALKGTQLEGRAIVVRFHEPDDQAVLRTSSAAHQAQRHESPPKPGEFGEEHVAQKTVKEAERLRREEEQREVMRRQGAARQQREWMEILAEQARLASEHALTDMEIAKDRVDKATESYNDFEGWREEVTQAIRKAEHTLDTLKARRDEVEQATSTVFLLMDAAETTYRDVRRRSEAAKKDSDRLRQWYAEAVRNEEKVLRSTRGPDEQAAEKESKKRRQAELTEPIRKRQGAREEEEADRQGRQERKQEEMDREALRREAERLAQEEQVRKEREQREKEARELLERKRQEERRQQEYRDASQRERTRCRDRDNISWAPPTQWTKERAINRFKAVSTEFDGIKFCDTQPLTFESVPWPLIHSPLTMKLDDIKWSAVEEFFAEVRLVVGAAEYRILVEKAHRRFHPDKWRGRGLLFTVLDEDLRRQLEEAGNVVAQAITPLWLASKSKK